MAGFGAFRSLSSPPSKQARGLPARLVVLSDLGASGADLSTPEDSFKCWDQLRPLICPRLKGHHLQSFLFKHQPFGPAESPSAPPEGSLGLLQSYHSYSLGDTPPVEGGGPCACF